MSTLCAGCGHDSISSAIIQAFFELDIAPHRVAKLSGHRLLVEDADVFSRQLARLQQRARAHAFGADRCQPRQSRPDLPWRVWRRRLGIDRLRAVRAFDAPRRQHGLHRREQRRVRADQGAVLRDGGHAARRASAVSSTATSRSTWSCWRCSSARASSHAASPATRTQLVPLIKAAVTHRGAAFIDVISPCVAFNNHAGSTKSYDFVREHNEAVNRLDFMPHEGGDHHRLRAGFAAGSAPARRIAAAAAQAARGLRSDRPHRRDELSSAAPRGGRNRRPGCSTWTPKPTDLHASLNTVDTALGELREAELIPGAAALEHFNATLR